MSGMTDSQWQQNALEIHGFLILKTTAKGIEKSSVERYKNCLQTSVH